MTVATMNKIALCLLALSLVVLGCKERPVNDEEVEPISLIQLIAQPEKHHGMYIGTVGVLRLDFEGTALHFSSEDAKLGIPMNAIWLRIEPPDVEKYQNLAQEHVIVHGVFDANTNGHMGLYRGSIVEIESIWPIPRPNGNGELDTRGTNE